MTLEEQDSPFRPPIARRVEVEQTWYTIYELTRREFLDAVEQAISRLPPPSNGVHWEYEGFNRQHLFLLPVADNSETGLIYQTVSLGLFVSPVEVFFHVTSSDDAKIELFRRLTVELETFPHIARACTTPCMCLDIPSENSRADWWNGKPSGSVTSTVTASQHQGEK